MKNIKKIIKVLYCLYLILLLCFIFSNSMASKEESAEISSGILTNINDFFDSVGLPFEFEHDFVRKMAHVIEFMTLGISLFGFLALNETVKIKNCVYCAFFSCLVAMTDETIQFFYERGSMVIDVWLDLVSAALGILAAYSIYYIHSQKRKADK